MWAILDSSAVEGKSGKSGEKGVGSERIPERQERGGTKWGEKKRMKDRSRGRKLEGV